MANWFQRRRERNMKRALGIIERGTQGYNASPYSTNEDGTLSPNENYLSNDEINWMQNYVSRHKDRFRSQAQDQNASSNKNNFSEDVNNNMSPEINSLTSPLTIQRKNPLNNVAPIDESLFTRTFNYTQSPQNLNASPLNETELPSKEIPLTFEQAYRNSKNNGDSTFSYKGKTYGTKGWTDYGKQNVSAEDFGNWYKNQYGKDLNPNTNMNADNDLMYYKNDDGTYNYFDLKGAREARGGNWDYDFASRVSNLSDGEFGDFKNIWNIYAKPEWKKVQQNKQGGTMIKRFQQGGQMTQEQQEIQQLAQAYQTDPQAKKQIDETWYMYKKQDPQNAQKFEQQYKELSPIVFYYSMSKQRRKAQQGMKFLEGGKCKKCRRGRNLTLADQLKCGGKKRFKKEEGGVVEEDKCGKKMPKKEAGGIFQSFLKKGGNLTKKKAESLKYKGGPGDIDSTTGMHPTKVQKKMMPKKHRFGSKVNGADKITIYGQPDMFEFGRFIN